MTPFKSPFPINPCTLLFQKGDSLVADAIMLDQGFSCDHVAGTWFDKNKMIWMVCEMVQKGLRATPFDQWWEANASTTVYVFDPHLNPAEEYIYNNFMADKIDSGTGYNFGGLFGFLPVLKNYWKRLTWGSGFDFCSELYAEYFLKVGRLKGLAAGRISPEYLLWLTQNSTLSIGGAVLLQRH